MSKSYWYFQNEPSIAEINGIPNGVQSIKSIVLGIESNPSFQAQIVYPAPWLLGADNNADLDAWFEYYVTALALKSEYPSNITLTPVDTFLSKHGIEYKKYKADDAEAVCLKLTHEEHLNLMDKLEKVAEIVDRPPLVYPKLGKVSQKKIKLVLASLNAGEVIEVQQENNCETENEIATLKTQIRELEQRFQVTKAEAFVLKNELKEIEAENQTLMLQLHELQAALEGSHLENIELKKEIEQTMEIVREAYNTLQPK